MRIVSHSRLICININHSLNEIQQNMLISCALVVIDLIGLCTGSFWSEREYMWNSDQAL